VGLFQIGAGLTLESTAISSGLIGCTVRQLFGGLQVEPTTVDTSQRGQNNRHMTRPEAARRVKSYSAPSGYVYQYYFYEVRKIRRDSVDGTEYVYMVSADRKKVFPLRIFVRHDAAEKWSHSAGRTLSGTEEYAVAKMRLFQSLDEIENPERLANNPPELVVDETNLGALLNQLDL
jgi:hypothetical protein